jgi:methenyltetrahydromethanopterin cyclohydrolase
VPDLSLLARPIADRLAAEPAGLGVRTITLPSGARLVDCGVEAPGSHAAGVALAEVCLAGLAKVTLTQSPLGARTVPVVQVSVATPWVPCLASQYAGWRVSADGFVAMGSGPARAVVAAEPLFDRLGYREAPQPTALVLEADRCPGDRVATWVAERCRIAPSDLTLLVAATGSAAGAVQIAARSVETALHKLDQLGFDVRRVLHGSGSCPVATPTRDFLEAFGRTNDAMLYGSEVEITVDASDEELAALVPRVPASASRDYGSPCAELLRRAGGDFYKLDPALFSPGRVTLVSAQSGRAHQAGRVDCALVARSFYGDAAA